MVDSIGWMGKEKQRSDIRRKETYLSKE